MAQHLGQPLATVFGVAETGFQINDVCGFQLTIVLDQQGVGPEQGVLAVGHSVCGKDAGDQLLGHVGLVDEVVHAPVEGF